MCAQCASHSHACACAHLASCLCLRTRRTCSTSYRCTRTSHRLHGVCRAPAVCCVACCCLVCSCLSHPVCSCLHHCRWLPHGTHASHHVVHMHFSFFGNLKPSSPLFSPIFFFFSIWLREREEREIRERK